MKIILFSVLLLASASVNAINTPYLKVGELKSWPTIIDVYFENLQHHECEGGHKTRYLLDREESNHLTLLLSSLMSSKTVSLSYECNAQGFPEIRGVRLK